MKVFLVFVFFSGLFTLNSNSLFSENFIGQSKTEIVKSVNDKYKTFKLNRAFVNNTFNYLKYEDRIREITVLFFLTDNNKCKMIRIMSDYSNLRDLKEELDNNYTSKEENLWEYNFDGTEYTVEMLEGDWFFTISIKEKIK